MKKLLTTCVAGAIALISYGQSFNEVTTPGLVPLNWSLAATADFNSDGNMDVISCGHHWIDGVQSPARHTYIHLGNGDGTFELLEQNEGLLGFSRYVHIEVADFNNDGHLDIVYGGNSGDQGHTGIYLYLNDGTGQFTQASGFPQDFFYDYNGAIEALDYNNDGNMDIMVSMWGGPDGAYNSVLVRNNGDETFDFDSSLENATDGYVDSALEVGDFDNDGDADALVTGYRNMNTDADALWQNNDGMFTQIDGVGFSNPDPTGGQHKFSSLGDVDGDGNLDIALKSEMPWGEDKLKTLIGFGGGDGTFTVEILEYMAATWDWGPNAFGDLTQDGNIDIYMTRPLKLMAGNGDGSFNDAGNSGVMNHFWGLYAVDFNGDNALDVLALGAVDVNEGGAAVYLNDNSVANEAPGKPTNLAMTKDGTDLILSWDAANDDHTTQASLSYNIYVKESGASNFVVSPAADITTGKRKIVATGNVGLVTTYTISGIDEATDYEWGVQAIDNSFVGGEFAVGGATSIAAVNAASFSVSPNPAQTSVALQGVNNVTSVEIIDLNGKVVKSFDSVNVDDVNVSDIKAGVYLVKVVSEKGADIQKLVIE